MVRVTDGDTLVVTQEGREEEVRLIGIDSPETGEKFSDQAKDELTSLVAGKDVVLKQDVEKHDQYGRLLAYVWTGEVFVNAEMLRCGLATLYTVPPNVEEVARLTAAQDDAKEAEVGVWGAEGSSPIKIVRVEYNPPGDDNTKLNDEFVVFQATVSGSLIGYSIEDQTGHRYSFPDLVVKTGKIITLHTGEGIDTDTDLYWGATGAAIWNNSGDTVKVLNPEDRIVASYAY